MQTALQELENTYFTLRSQINLLSQACQTQDQRDALTAQYTLAQTNYWNCVNKAFHDLDPDVANLTAQIDAANKAVTADANQMNDITKVLGDITTVVTMGTQLAAKVIGA